MIYRCTGCEEGDCCELRAPDNYDQLYPPRCPWSGITCKWEIVTAPKLTDICARCGGTYGSHSILNECADKKGKYQESVIVDMKQKQAVTEENRGKK